MSDNQQRYYARKSDKKDIEKNAYKDYRSQYMRDEGRVVHSFAFRRLQGKTQILGIEQGDYHRNRLTHSLEVASIAKSVAGFLYDQYVYVNNSVKDECLKLLECKELEGRNRSLKDYDHLITTISLLHDIGHPPFGHAGEEALNFKMYDCGGFEGNAQTLRLVTDLEDYRENHGLDLTSRALLGLIKYPNTYNMLVNKDEYPDPPDKNRSMEIGRWKPPKCIYNESNEMLNWLLNSFSQSDQVRFSKTEFKEGKSSQNHKETKHKSFDCSIMDIADDISYTAHDLEDAIFMGLIQKDDFDKNDWEDIKNYFGKDYQEKGGKREWHKDMCDRKNHIKKEAFSHMVGMLVRSLCVKEDKEFNSPLLGYNVRFQSETYNVVEKIKKLIAEKTHQTQEIQTIVFGGMIRVMQLFDVLYANRSKLLPIQFQKKLTGSDEIVNKRVVCDYIASMTDEYARRLHERIYCDLPGSVFYKL